MSRKGDAVALLLMDLYAEGIAYETEYRFDQARKWRFDIAIPDRKLAIEVDGGTWVGGRHTTGAGFRRDCEKMNAATVQGWRVLRFTSDMVRDGALGTIQAALR